MNDCPYFEVKREYAVFRPTGEISLEGAMDMVGSALEATRAAHLRKVLVVLTSLSGLRIPDTFERFECAVRWAEKADWRIRMAVAAKPELIDPDRFGVTVARNRGLEANVFSTEAEALHWLMRD